MDTQEMLERLWMRLGHGRCGSDMRQRDANHKYLQRLVEGRPEVAEGFKEYCSPEVIKAVEDLGLS